jgi:hypothetical protein
MEECVYAKCYQRDQRKIGTSSRLHCVGGYTDSESSSVTGLDSFGGAVPVSLTDEFGIGGSTQAEPIFYMYYPGVGSSSLAAEISKNIGHQWNITDTVDSSFGHHHLRFGLDFRRIVAPLIPNSPLAEAFYESAIGTYQ